MSTFRHHSQSKSVASSECFAPPPDYVGIVQSAASEANASPATIKGAATVGCGGLLAGLAFGAIYLAFETLARDEATREIAYRYLEPTDPLGLVVMLSALVVGGVVGFVIASKRTSAGRTGTTTYVGDAGAASVASGGGGGGVRYADVAQIRISDRRTGKNGRYLDRTYVFVGADGKPRFSTSVRFLLAYTSTDVTDATPMSGFAHAIGQQLRAARPDLSNLPAEWGLPFKGPY